MVDSQQVSRPGNEQILLVEDDDGAEYEAEMETIVERVNGEEVRTDQYYVDEDVPDAVAAEIDAVNQELKDRGADQTEDVDQVEALAADARDSPDVDESAE